MISPETEQILTDLQSAEQSQKPSELMHQWLQHTTLVGIVSPSASGKNMLMDRALETYPSWHYVPSVTTRPQQDRDTPGSYRQYIPHTDTGIATVYADIKSGKLLQYAMHPLTKHIMATYLSDYSGEVNLKDLYASSVDSFRKLGFGTLLIISLVTPYSLWRPRFDARFPIDDSDKAKRLAEAFSSSAWSLEQADSEDHYYLVNDGTPAQVSQKFLNIIKHRTIVDPNGASIVKQFKDRLEAENV